MLVGFALVVGQEHGGEAFSHGLMTRGLLRYNGSRTIKIPSQVQLLTGVIAATLRRYYSATFCGHCIKAR